MKKLLFTFLGIAVIFSLAFKNGVANKATFNHKAAKWNDWGEWKVTSCYKGLDYRVKRSQRDPDSKGRYEWDVQFRNRYQDVINFNFKVAEPGYNGPTLDRQSVNENGTSNGNDWGLIANAAECQVVVDKVRFGADDDGSKPYLLCGDIYASVSSANSPIVNNPSGNSVVANNSSTSDQTAVNNSEATNNINGTNNTVLTPLQHINNSQTISGDAIQQTLALERAKINSRLNTGSTLQQQQQIQQVQKQQNASTVAATTELAGGIVNLIGAIGDRKRENDEAIARVKANEQYRTNSYIENNKTSDNPDVLYMVGFYCFLQNNNDCAFYWNKAAEMGSVKAMKRLSFAYMVGEGGLTKSYDLENYWLSQAALKNDMFSLYVLGWRSIPKNGDCLQNLNALSFFAKVEELCSIKQPTVSSELSWFYFEGSNTDDGDDYLAYCFTEKAIGDIYSLCGEKNKSEKESLIDAIAHYNKSLELSDGVRDRYNNKRPNDDIKKIKKAISADEKRLKALGYNGGYGSNTLPNQNDIVQAQASNSSYNQTQSIIVSGPALDYYKSGYNKYQAHDFTGAIADLDEAIKINSEYADAYHIRGHSKAWLNHNEDVIEDENKAIIFNPRNDSAYFERAMAKMRLKRQAEAIPDFDQAIKLNPNGHYQYYYYRGIANQDLERYNDALFDFSLALKIEPYCTFAYRLMGLMEVYLSRYTEAIVNFNLEIKDDQTAPWNWENYNYRGYANFKLGNYQQAIADDDMAIQLAGAKYKPKFQYRDEAVKALNGK